MIPIGLGEVLHPSSAAPGRAVWLGRLPPAAPLLNGGDEAAAPLSLLHCMSRPAIADCGMQPKERLSHETSSLSPMTKY